MTIKEEVNRQIKHIEAKIIDMEGFNPYKTKESIIAMYWCGRQAASTTIDFIDTLQSLGMITTEEHTEYCSRIRDLNNLLVETYNRVSK